VAVTLLAYGGCCGSGTCEWKTRERVKGEGNNQAEPAAARSEG